MTHTRTYFKRLPLPATTTLSTSSPSYTAFKILQTGFTVLPLIAGVDKFFHVLVNWNVYLAPPVERFLPLPAAAFMSAVGIVEIIAGLTVAVRPRFGGYLVATWLGAIVVNLLLIPGYFDIALRDFGLMLGALALAKLAAEYEPMDDAMHANSIEPFQSESLPPGHDRESLDTERLAGARIQ